MEITTERVALSDVELQCTVAGDGPLVLLIHGFPELAYSWRHQIRDLAAAGYRVVAPDMRGYGASDRPDAIEDYDIFHLVGDVVGLIRHFGADKATVVGHDWGALVAWSMGVFRPDLLHGVCGVSVPFMPHLAQSLPDILRQNVGEDGFHYMLYFQEVGPAETELEADIYTSMRKLFWMVSADLPEFASTGDSSRTGFLPDVDLPDGVPGWMTEGDLLAYVQAFTRTGFGGGINWYRNLQRNWELGWPWHDKGISVPAMFIGGRDDPVLAGSAPVDTDHPMLQFQAAYVPDLRVRLIDGAGHWTQQEKADETSAALVDFLGELHS